MDESSVLVAHDAVAFSHILHVFIGLYIWEWFTSLRFEWLLIRSPKKFRWPFVFYFLNRYCLLSVVIGVAVALNHTREIDCEALYMFNLYMGNIAIGLANINLSLRTMEAWYRKWYIVCLLVTSILGHLSLLLQGARLDVVWITGHGCTVAIPERNMLLVALAYTAGFNLLLFLVAGWGFASSPSPGTRSHLLKIFFDDGLVLFFIAFLAGVSVTILVYMHMEQTILILLNLPLAIVCTITASRVVRKASESKPFKPEMFTLNVSGDHITIRSSIASSVVRPKFSVPPDGVHVQVCRQVDV